MAQNLAVISQSDGHIEREAYRESDQGTNSKHSNSEQQSSKVKIGVKDGLSEKCVTLVVRYLIQCQTGTFFSREDRSWDKRRKHRHTRKW